MGIPGLAEIIARGWVVVVTDYAVPNLDAPYPYMIGEGEARFGLDSVRAAKRIPKLKLEDRTVVWGHSQGRQSALWTAIRRPAWAVSLGRHRSAPA